MENNIKKKKPIYKRWWFWVVAGIFVIALFGSHNSDNTGQELSKPTTTQESSVNENQTPIVTTTPKPKITTTPTQKPGTTSSSSKSGSTSSTSNKNQTIVYYVPGSKVYHLSKSDSTLRRSKTILSMTLAEAESKGMHQSKSTFDQ